LGQKTHPIGLRLGIIRSWDSNWYDEKSFAGKLSEDMTIRNYVRNRLKKAGISRILIERTPKRAVITINTSRPGIVIGRSGKEISQLEEELKKITSKDVKILINEIKRPELDAYLMPAGSGAAATLLHPEFSVVVPQPDPVKIPSAFGVALHASDLVVAVNEWIVFARSEGTIQRAYDYWVLGKGAEEKRRRWSVMHDVLGWER